MPTLLERYARNDVEDRLYLGALVEEALRGEFGELLRHLVTGMTAEWLAVSEGDTNTKADRYLGRIEALTKLLDRLAWMVEAKQRLLEEEKAKQHVQTEARP